MALGLFEQLAWLTTRVKRLCCAVDKIKQSGAGSYKVYTALLTQQGSSPDFQNLSFEDAEPLIVGATYEIADNAGVFDATNIGAPNNNIGTFFVATGATPTSWGEGSFNYQASAPRVTSLLENTIGNVWFQYDSGGGRYYASSNGLFTNLKTYTVLSSVNSDPGTIPLAFVKNSMTSLPYSIGLQVGSGDDTDAFDNKLINQPIEIRVYN